MAYGVGGQSPSHFTAYGNWPSKLGEQYPDTHTYMHILLSPPHTEQGLLQYFSKVTFLGMDGGVSQEVQGSESFHLTRG